jgi:hypothetical protein
LNKKRAEEKKKEGKHVETRYKKRGESRERERVNKRK